MRILLLGASGYVGGALWQAWSERHDVVGTCASARIPGLVPLDLGSDRTADELRDLLATGFDVVVHAAGLVDLAAAQARPERAHTLNAESVGLLRQAVGATGGAKVVLLSTDNVFDGARGVYVEGDARNPVNVYGRSKCAAEDALLGGGGGGHLVVRIPMVFGRSPFSDRFLARFGGETTPAQTDVLCAPLYLPFLATTLEDLWSMDGIVHLGGAEVVSRYALMSRAAAVLELPTRVVPVRNDEAFPWPPRPRNVVLRSRRHASVGPDVEQALVDLAG